MSLRYAILGLLARQPSSGYELTRKFDSSLRTAWHAQHSQIYPELAKLEAEGLAEIIKRGARGSKTYGLTESGHDALRHWLVEVAPDRSQRNESAVRLFLTQLMAPRERRLAFERDLAYVHQQTAELRLIKDQLAPDEPFAPQVELGLRTNAVLSAWLQEQADAATREGGDGPQ
ncbi:PadR family transcriptional regulator [Arthrobacter frigidicola]|nr:PadR family transcriptional regulator [Arthrobacter frigidicola]